jgi:hypothetical protein
VEKNCFFLLSQSIIMGSEEILNEIINKVEIECSPTFSIGIRFPTSGNNRSKKKPVKAKNANKKKQYKPANIQTTDKIKIQLFTDKKKLLIDCPYFELKTDLLNTEPLKRFDIIKKYTNRRIFPESIKFEKSLSFKIPNMYEIILEFLKEYIKKESKCRWQFKKLMNFWIFKKYSKNVFNTEDPITCCIPEKPLLLYSVKQKGAYIFERSSLKRHFEMALKFSEYTIPKPMKPKNPLTNLCFSLTDQIAIIEKLRDNSQTSWILEGYRKFGYKLRKFSENFNTILRCEIINEFCRNAQLEESKDHFLDFLEYIFDMYNIDSGTYRMRTLKWAICNLHDDDFVKSWRKIYRDYYYMKYQYPTVDINDMIYENIFLKISDNLKKPNEYRRLSQIRLLNVLI